MKNHKLMGLFVFLALATFSLSGCGDVNKDGAASVYPHPAGWVSASGGSTHPAAYHANPGTCTECHGTDLDGGISKVSCSTCHPWPYGHPLGWDAFASHGSAAKAAAPGLASCTQCHGTDYNGGSSNQSCKPCHAPSTAPHPATPWRGTTGTGTTHTTTDVANVAECARCHLNNQKRTVPEPVPSTTTPGCFNATLCHGSVASHATTYPGSAHMAATGIPTTCASCHNTTSTTGVYPAAGGTAPNCAGCHITALFVGCSDCHGDQATGRPNGTTFPNRQGEHRNGADKHSNVGCTTCHPFSTGNPLHGWAANRVKSTAAQVKVDSITGWVPADKSCNPACHNSKTWY